MLILKIFQRLGYCIETAIAKIRYGNFLQVKGLFRKRRDTQIILEEKGKIFIGKDVSFQRNVSLTSVSGILTIGSGVGFNRNCIVICREKITIGDHVIFGPGVTIYDHDHEFSFEGILSGYRHGSVVIEKGCWIGANVTILRNTHIGENCVIGAGTILSGEIPPHSLVTSDRRINITPITKD